MATSLVNVAHAVKSYRVGHTDVRGIEDFSLHADVGEMCALVGVSGSGKSTLLHVLGGLLPIDGGIAVVDGIDLGGLRGDALARYRRDTVAMVFQEYNLLPMLTVLENVALVGYLAETDPQQSRRFALESLATMGLAAQQDRFPAQLSGGQRQRVAIARALAGRQSAGKRLLLADEPSGSLDRATTLEVVVALRQVADAGLAVIVATHDPLVVEGCDRVVQIRDGRNAEQAVRP